MLVILIVVKLVMGLIEPDIIIISVGAINGILVVVEGSLRHARKDNAILPRESVCFVQLLKPKCVVVLSVILLEAIYRGHFRGLIESSLGYLTQWVCSHLWSCSVELTVEVRNLIYSAAVTCFGR